MMFDGEPVRGLPARLPEGETVVWQGAPDLQALAGDGFHLVGFAIYFDVLVGWAAISASLHGENIAGVALTTAKFGGLACAALGIVAIYAWLVARSTMYTITTRRLVVRIGVCLPVTINIPFCQMSGAGLKLFRDGCGNIELDVSEAKRMSYILLWPHVRPWRIGHPRPALLCVPDARTVASMLARAVAAADVTEVALAPIGQQLAGKSAPVAPEALAA